MASAKTNPTIPKLISRNQSEANVDLTLKSLVIASPAQALPHSGESIGNAFPEKRGAGASRD
jgi:hypothetical protein